MNEYMDGVNTIDDPTYNNMTDQKREKKARQTDGRTDFRIYFSIYYIEKLYTVTNIMNGYTIDGNHQHTILITI